jgi:hypothetical protein
MVMRKRFSPLLAFMFLLAGFPLFGGGKKAQGALDRTAGGLNGTVTPDAKPSTIVPGEDQWIETGEVI